ncbi:UDP-glucose/GDP-mannose dehydrogenase family protein [Bacillus sp. 03113]|uniref:UDP-glucose dehydrogenase family protein n=1 Tax=Bacillus sp. 03113 TaxID=2578211 RepID=UPI0011439089|nr:UDP-glucose/GDP-mannose dehydrogenase family protein [Bacillus sp. 03113]
MNIAVVGTGYVGLVTGVCLAEIGHNVSCIDIDEQKVLKLKKGFSPIYEPELENLMKKNIKKNRLSFTTSHNHGFSNAEIIIIAVGTPEKPDGSANLSYIEQTAKDIAEHINNDVIVVTKSTVPINTNDYIETLIKQHLKRNVKVHIASNPEFLREGSAVYDSFHGDRIVIGTKDETVAATLEKMYKPLSIPIFKTDIRTAEMIKYASNSFLATKISFINEISNFCEIAGANIEEVAVGMGMDKRIGLEFLKAGIGYGGSCFPKDTSALLKMAQDQNYDMKILNSVIEVNDEQKTILVKRALKRFGTLTGMKVAVLGLAFKPNTDDMREASSLDTIDQLLELGATVIAYDPIAMPNAKKILSPKVVFSNSVKDVLQNADCAFILTEWQEFKETKLYLISLWMKEPIIFDGRNCFSIEEMKRYPIEYHSMGRPSLYVEKTAHEN